jgi:hypothetical protein
MRGKALRFLHIVKHKNGTRSVPGCIPTRSVGNDQWAAGRDWSAVRPPSPASQLPQGSGYICRRLGGCQAVIAGRPAPTGFGVHLQEIGRLAGRHRWQASSHSGSVYICRRLVGCQAAIASKLAPTGLGVHLQEIGRLSGRHHWQASSYRGMGCI